MAQASITTFFRKRKRPNVDDIKSRAKVLVLEQDNVSADATFKSLFVKEENHLPELTNSKATENVQKESLLKAEEEAETDLLPKCVIQTQCKLPESVTVVLPKTLKQARYKTASNKRSSKVKHSAVSFTAKQCDIRQSFPVKPVNKCDTNLEHTPVNGLENETYIPKEQVPGSISSTAEDCLSPEPNIVPFHLKGSLTPSKSGVNETTASNLTVKVSTPVKTFKSSVNVTPTVSGELSVTKTGSTSKINIETEIARKELGLITPKRLMEIQKEGPTLSEIKAKLSRSGRLAELRQSIKRFQNSAKQLNELEEKSQGLKAASPCLQKFKSIELEVPVSPQKCVSPSPQKILCSSPLRDSPLKGAAYQRFASLTQPGSSGLPLPYHYRFLAEVFRCVDTITSMLNNRKEVVTFSKLKPAVQEMLRRNFTEHHLGQIKTVLPSAYAFHQEKCRLFGSMSQMEKYELIVTPIVASKSEGTCDDHLLMTPSILLERRQTFHYNLLEKIKDKHEEFLQSLDPPVVVSRSKLTRWHPEFDLERLPDIEPESLPQPPNVEKISTAKDVLDRAKTLFSCNQRMERALLKANELIQKQTPGTPTKSNNSSSQPSTSPLLKGLPKSLIDKIRAKQAAKAVLAMTRTPVQDLEAVQHTRLPELARILRNLFVAEKKGVLPLEMVMEKLARSYRENLLKADFEVHLQLLMKYVPDWLEIHTIRKSNYLKLAKNVDMTTVLKKLETVAAEMNDRDLKAY